MEFKSKPIIKLFKIYIIYEGGFDSISYVMIEALENWIVRPI